MKRFMRLIMLGVIIACSVLFFKEAKAGNETVFRYKFIGTVAWAYGTPLGLHASTGDIVTGTFGYDTSIPLLVEHGTYGLSSSWGDSLQTDPTLLSVTVNGVTVFGDPSGLHSQFFDEYYGMDDQFKCFSQWESSGRAMNSVFLQLFGPHELFSRDISYPLRMNFSDWFDNAGWVQSSGDGPIGQDEGQIRFTITNFWLEPAADAGSAQSVSSGDLVQLNGSNSTPAGNISYQWLQTSGPVVTLSDPTIVNPTFTAPSVGADGAALIFQLTVTDISGQSAQATCTITVSYVSQPPENQCVQCAPGLVSWWAAEGNANDSKGTNIGTLNGGAAYASGKVGQAFSVNGNTGSLVVVPDDAGLNFGPNFPMTVELWAYRTGTNWAQHILGKRADCGVNIIPDHNYQMGWYSPDGDWFGSYSGGALTGGREADLPLNTWTHLAGTFDGAAFKFYVNGALAGTGTGTLGPIFATPFTMGSSGTCGNYGQGFVGLLDEVSLYNRALTTAEIQAIFNAGSAGKCKQLPPPNQPPAADAGADQTARAGDPVVLDGSKSIDLDGGIVSYVWEQTSGPTVQLSNSSVVNPTFTAPNVKYGGDAFTFELTVTDSQGLTAADTCIVNVAWANQPPAANAGGDQTVNAGDQVTLDGSKSTDPDDGISSYLWNQVSGTPVTLSNPAAIQSTFTAPHVKQAGEKITFQLTVTDKNGLQSTATCAVNVNWVNTPPVAKAGVNILILSKDKNTTVLIGTANDADGQTLTYKWFEGDILFTSGQVGVDGTCPLNLGSISQLSLGQHTLILEVSDGYDTSRDSMFLTVENSSPTVAPSGEGTYQVNTPVILGGQVSDYDGDQVTYAWMEGAVNLSSGTIQTSVGGAPVGFPQFSISNLTIGTHIITLQASDGINEPAAMTITVTIIDTTAPTLAPVADKTILWPPNHQMVDVLILANAGDNSGIPVKLKAAIACNESVLGSVYWTEPAINQNTGVISLKLMAERLGNGNGRQYTVTITATDETGNASTANVKIVVPHDQGKNNP